MEKNKIELAYKNFIIMNNKFDRVIEDAKALTIVI